MNVADSIDQHAQATPDAPAILKGDLQLSYAEAATAVRRIASILASRGVQPSDFVGLSMRARPELLLLGMLSLARLGAAFVPILPEVARAKREVIADHFKLAAIVTDQDELGAGSARTILADASWLQPGAPEKAPPDHPGGEHPWCVTLTSGTTGAPKGVLRTHAGFLRLSALQRPLAQLGPDSRFFCFMNLHSAPALLRAMNHLVHGSAIVFADEATPGTGLSIERHRVTHLFASPVMMQYWLRARPRGRPPLGTLTRLEVGGGMLADGLAREIVERITPNLFLCYGTTETGVVAMADLRLREQHPDAVGLLVPWVEAQVVDESDHPLPTGEQGTLRFRGEGVAGGYYGIAPDASARAKAFRDGWFYPGDLGRIDRERMLYVEGRTDDLVNIGGPKLNAAEIEAVFAQHPSVREAAVFSVVTPAGKTRLVAAVAVHGTFDRAALVQHYKDRGGRLTSLLRIVEFPRLPRSATGKVLKQELKRRLRFKPASSP